MEWKKFVETIRVEVPWYEVKGQIKRRDRVEDFRVLRDQNGVPLDLLNVPTLVKGLTAACEAVGAKYLGFEGKSSRSPFNICERCGGLFRAERPTRARFCKNCLAFRASHEGRKQLDPDYEETNRKRVSEWREQNRKRMEKATENPDKFAVPKSQNRNGRSKNKPRQ
jgi:hypothetical protein